MLRSVTALFVLLLLGSFFLSLETSAPPPGPIGPYLNGVFPESAPHVGLGWKVEDPMPDVTFQSPVRILPFPGSEDILVLSKMGEVWRVSVEQQTRTMILDIKDRAFKGGEAGTVGMVLHPKFGDPAAPDQQLLFLFYRSKPEPDDWDERGFNRLSKFRWDADQQQFDLASEEILIQHYDRSTWHNGGGMFFGPDGFLYVSLGDEGHGDFRAESTQRLDGGLFSGIIRIDVDNDPTRSHPIRRQPVPNQAAPAGWGETFTQGYSIPNDNPWQDPDGGILEEFYAIGVRSPFGMQYDPLTQKIWLADVGGKQEEVSMVSKGDNLQWPYLEGELPSDDMQRPADFIGREKPPLYVYERGIGSCVIGGNVYHGTLFPELNGKYLLADFVENKVMAITLKGSNEKPTLDILLSLWVQDVVLPDGLGISGIFPMPDGEILITVKGDDLSNTGKIFRLTRQAEVAEPPARLSELGVFSDLQQLTPAPGLIPYRVNAPLWSDRAGKQRWMAVPNDGAFDTDQERILFNRSTEWSFPEGTVFVKHFELPRTTTEGGPSTRLETRFFIIGRGGRGYGLTYRWNDQGTDAFLLGGGTSEDYMVEQEDGASFSQRWDFPSREQCMSCHNANAGFVLGVKTHQLNGTFYYDHLNRSMNQLEYFDQLGLFQNKVGAVQDLPKAFAIDDGTADLQLRVRSYLDANCSFCHRLQGVATTNMDLRLNIPLILQNLINAPTASSFSDPSRNIVEPGSHATSEIWIRDASDDVHRMPPIASNLVDQVYVDALAEWIDQLPEDAGRSNEVLLFPNPSSGWFSLRFSDEWNPPFRIRVFNAAGQILTDDITDSRAAPINLSRQAPGIYFLEVITDGVRHVEKLVVH
ncbi:PQQ-dependent sugar dehydrogenase [Flavilitoribacter nigricans]|uniref:T9SS type A sorting domain-containing protein n=1 Tax=Flavilitoribacter nigricans (strain ATCC 23147 / DSM 23189 / NBRC 102662 / NCIMB 1420 / SS-2) TaxID=1122177 RepID=A0A2D0NG34_FLAN2|nr:PQQ-dependent sugar dehydrogenase [Flavilitoribacter nigricans]PHN07464.1 hypothetical protein CRP01_05010 [Flavilitoribacter nigricans DSM 23189 = NBRC 102662]